MASVKLTEKPIVDASDDMHFVAEQNGNLVRANNLIGKLKKMENEIDRHNHVIVYFDWTEYGDGTGWSRGLYSGEIGSKINTDTGNTYCLRLLAPFAADSRCEKLIITPPEDKTVQVIETDSNGIIANIFGYRDNRPSSASVFNGKPLEVYTSAGNKYYITIGRYSGTATTYANDAEYTNSIIGIVVVAATDATLTQIGRPADASAVGSKFDAVYGNIESLEKRPVADTSLPRRVANLEAVTNGALYRFDTDAAEARKKEIPSDAMPWATLDFISGKTLRWNQLHNSTAFRSDKEVNFTWENGMLTVSGTATANAYWLTASNGWFINFIQGHKYMVVVGNDEYHYGAENHCEIYIPFADQIRIPNDYFIFDSPDTTEHYVQFRVVSGHTVNQMYYPQVFDLTDMYGSGNEPDADAFRAAFPADYYPHSEPALIDFIPHTIVSNGRNLLNVNVGQFEQHQVTSGSSSSDRWGVVVDIQEPGMYYLSVKNYIAAIGYGPQSDDGNYVREGQTRGCAFHADKGKYFIFCTSTGSRDPACQQLLDSCIMLNRGETAMPYAPYREPEITDLTDVATAYFPDGMRSIGNVHDSFEADDDGNVWAVKRIHRTDLGNASWV